MSEQWVEFRVGPNGLTPSTWAWTEMGSIATVVGGGTPSTTDPSIYGGEIAWITPADLSGYKGKLVHRGARNITNKGLANSSARLLPVGTAHSELTRSDRLRCDCSRSARNQPRIQDSFVFMTICTQTLLLLLPAS